MNSSDTNITAKAEFICSNKAYYSSSIGYLSKDRIIVLVMIQQLIKYENMLDFCISKHHLNSKFLSALHSPLNLLNYLASSVS